MRMFQDHMKEKYTSQALTIVLLHLLFKEGHISKRLEDLIFDLEAISKGSFFYPSALEFMRANFSFITKPCYFKMSL